MGIKYVDLLFASRIALRYTSNLLLSSFFQMLPRENIRGAALNPLRYQKFFSSGREEWRPRERVLLSIRFEITSHLNPPEITLSAEPLRVIYVASTCTVILVLNWYREIVFYISLQFVWRKISKQKRLS